MSVFKHNTNNTEGHHPTSFDFIDTEVRKGDKIVATDLVDLYDVNVDGVVDGEILIYDELSEKWVPGKAGSGCSFLSGNIYRIGIYGDFDTLKDCFDWLRNFCKVIDENNMITLLLVQDITLLEKTSLNHPYGHNIIIDGGGHTIKTHYNNNPELNLSLSKSHSINFTDCSLLSLYTGTQLESHYMFDMNEGSTFSPIVEHNFLTSHNGTIYSIGGIERDSIGNAINVNKMYKCTSILYSNWELVLTYNEPSIYVQSNCTVKHKNKLITFEHDYNYIANFETAHIYDFDANTWSETDPSTGDVPPTGLCISNNFVLFDNKIYIVGGYVGSSENYTVYVYDIILNSWSILTVLDVGLYKLSNHSSVVYEGKLYIYGSDMYKSRSYDTQFSNALLTLDLVSGDIEVIIPQKTYYENSYPHRTGIAGHRSAIVDGVFYVYFGYYPLHGYTVYAGTTEIYGYNLTTGKWARHTRYNTLYGYGFAFTVMDDTSYIFGGRNYIYGKNDSNIFMKIHNRETSFLIDGKPSSMFDINHIITYGYCFDVLDNSCLNNNNISSGETNDRYIDPISFDTISESEYHVSYTIMSDKVQLFRLENSTLKQQSGYIRSMAMNRSSLDMTPTYDVIYTIENGSVVITDDPSKFLVYSTFEHSKLITKKH